MGNFLDKLKGIFFGDEYDDEYDDDDDYQIDDNRMDNRVDNTVSNNVAPFNRYSAKRTSIASINANPDQLGVCMYSPKNLEDASDIVSKLKENIVVINLESDDCEMPQRISDFLCGAGYALDGNIQLVSNMIIIIAPNDVEISGELKDKLQANGIKIPNSTWS